MFKDQKLRVFIILLLFYVSGFVHGCSLDPLTPGPADDQEPNVQLSASAESGINTRGCLGFCFIEINRVENKVSIIPVRSGELHLNLLNILNSSMGVSAAVVSGESDPATGLFVMDITLDHPFGSKEQFAGFDVKGILVTSGSLDIDGHIFADTDETQLENADGFTRWWNPTEFTKPGLFGYTSGNMTGAQPSQLTATINPYKYFADELSATSNMGPVHDEPLESDTGRGVFRAGSSNTRRYEIRFPMDPGPQILFGYAIDSSWAPPSPNPPAEVPDDFPIEANMPEPYDTFLLVDMNTLYYDSESGVGGGVFRARLNVYDWQGQDAGDIAGEVDSVTFYSPDMFPGGVTGSYVTETATKARYSVDFTGTASPAHAGKTVLGYKIVSGGGQTYNQGVAPAPSDTVAAWGTTVLDIPDPECTGDSNNDWLEAEVLDFGDHVIDQICLPTDYKDFYTFELPPGSDTDGELVLYCNAEPSTLGIYTQGQVLVTESAVSSGMASIDFTSLDIEPGSYYIRVHSSATGQTAPYLLEFDTDLIDVVPDTPVEVTPEYLFMKAHTVYKHENLVYLMGNMGFWVYDVSDPGNPVQIAGEDFNVTMDSCFCFPYIYFQKRVNIDESELNLIDVSDPLSPVLHEDLVHYNIDLAALAMNSTHLYVGTSVNPGSEIIIYEYSADPLNPSEVGSFAVSYEPQILDLYDAEGSDTKLIVGTWNDVLSYHVEDPSSVVSTGSYNFPAGTPRDIKVEGNYIYVAYDETAGGEGWLYIFYQTASNIFQYGSVDIPGSASHIDAEWPYAYIGDGYAGLTICDISNQTSPSYICSTNLISYAYDLVYDDDYVYIIPQDAGLQVIDVSIAPTPVPVTRLKVVNCVYSFVEVDDYLIVAELGSGEYGAFKTVDISNPALPEVVSEYFPLTKPSVTTSEGNLMASAGLNKQWKLFDISDPLDISPYGSVPESDYIYEMGINGDAIFVYVSSPGFPLKIYDISDPYYPKYETTISLSNPVLGISFSGEYMYISTGGYIEVYSITDPFSPSHVHTYGSSPLGYEMTVTHGDLLYAVADDVLEIADISTPSTPSYLGSTLIPDISGFGFNTLCIDGQFAYVGGQSALPYSCWVWPPADPQPIAPIYDGFSHGTRALLVRDGYLIEGCGQWGLRIFDLY